MIDDVRKDFDLKRKSLEMRLPLSADHMMQISHQQAMLKTASVEKGTLNRLLIMNILSRTGHFSERQCDSLWRKLGALGVCGHHLGIFPRHHGQVITVPGVSDIQKKLKINHNLAKELRSLLILLREENKEVSLTKS